MPKVLILINNHPRPFPARPTCLPTCMEELWRWCLSAVPEAEAWSPSDNVNAPPTCCRTHARPVGGGNEVDVHTHITVNSLRVPNNDDSGEHQSLQVNPQWGEVELQNLNLLHKLTCLQLRFVFSQRRRKHFQNSLFSSLFSYHSVFWCSRAKWRPHWP